MNKAFIFDMDGVLINSESEWEKIENDFLLDLFGNKIYQEVKDALLGGNTNHFYEIATKHGFTMSKKRYFELYDSVAEKIYERAALTDGISELIEILKQNNYRIGLVSSSRDFWIQCALKKMPFREYFDYVVSVNDREDLKAKPHPDGYIEAMSHLGSTPDSTIILEDSNTGIQAGVASQAFTICLRQNLNPDNVSKGADMYVETVKDLIKFFTIVSC